MKKIIITGKNGQLANSLFNFGKSRFEIYPLDKKEFDIRNHEKCESIIFKYKPDYIINTAAYTAVDLAETDKKLAYEVNSTGAENLARCIAKIGGKLLHISTDFVFDGKNNIPYKTDDICNPINTYGKSKLSGEKLILNYPNTMVLRTSWLYSSFGKNFCTTMLKLHKNFHTKKIPLKVVSDQKGSPTSCESLSMVCFKFLETLEFDNNLDRIYHWSDAGISSWYDLSKEIGRLGKKYSIIESPAEVIPIKSIEYLTHAERPKFSVLNCKRTEEVLGVKQSEWEIELENVIKSINKKDFNSILK